MKKIFYLIACAIVFFACSTPEPEANIEDGTPCTEVEVYGPVASNSQVKRIISNKGVSAFITIENATDKLSVSNDEKNLFMQYFPSGVNKIDEYTQNTPSIENFALDFLYVSEGTAFDIYPVYSNGWYDLTLGLFYYDENGALKTIDFWNMQDDNWGKKSYSYLLNNHMHNVSDYEVFKTSADGYTISLPKGTLFGFYVNCDDDSQAGLFYCAKMENGTYGYHAASFANNGRSYIGFEDQNGGDNDLNDIICFIDPKQAIIENPTKEDVLSAIKGLDIPGEIEVDIHQQKHDDWGEIKTSIHARHCFDSIVVTMPIPKDYILEKDDMTVRVFDGYYQMEDENYRVNTVVRHGHDKTTITVKDVDPVLTNRLLKQYEDGITVEVHSYTRECDKEYVYDCMKESHVDVCPKMDNCEKKVNKSTAYDFH